MSQKVHSMLKIMTMLVAKKCNNDTLSEAGIQQHILTDLSTKAGKRLLRNGGIKRKRFDDEGLEQFSLMDEEKRRSK